MSMRVRQISEPQISKYSWPSFGLKPPQFFHFGGYSLFTILYQGGFLFFCRPFWLLRSGLRPLFALQLDYSFALQLDYPLPFFVGKIMLNRCLKRGIWIIIWLA